MQRFRLFVGFQSGMVPAVWLKSIINLIPKNSTTDHSNPLEYRGIALASSVYNQSYGVLNTRLGAWAEEAGILSKWLLAHKGNSCIDHISSLYSHRNIEKAQIYINSICGLC